MESAFKSIGIPNKLQVRFRYTRTKNTPKTAHSMEDSGQKLNIRQKIKSAQIGPGWEAWKNGLSKKISAMLKSCGMVQVLQRRLFSWPKKLSKSGVESGRYFSSPGPRHKANNTSTNIRKHISRFRKTFPDTFLRFFVFLKKMLFVFVVVCYYFSFFVLSVIF